MQQHRDACHQPGPPAHPCRYFNYRDSYKASGGDNFVPGGMYQIMNKLATAQDIRLNRTVTKIKWNGTQVQVRGCAARLHALPACWGKLRAYCEERGTGKGNIN